MYLTSYLDFLKLVDSWFGIDDFCCPDNTDFALLILWYFHISKIYIVGQLVKAQHSEY